MLFLKVAGCQGVGSGLLDQGSLNSEISLEVMKDMGSTKDKTDSKQERDQPFHMRLPGFIQEEVGLGDVIKKITYGMGIKPCGGCEQRAAALNRWLRFSR